MSKLYTSWCPKTIILHMVPQCTVFIAPTVQNIVLQPAGEAKGNKYITGKEHLRQNDYSLNWFPPSEQPQYYLKFYKSIHSRISKKK